MGYHSVRLRRGGAGLQRDTPWEIAAPQKKQRTDPVGGPPAAESIGRWFFYSSSIMLLASAMTSASFSLGSCS